MSNRSLRRKWSFRIGGKKQILVKHQHEREEHVLMKAFMAQLYDGQFGDIKIEQRYKRERKYKPDLLSISAGGEPQFWGECGKVSEGKMAHLFRTYPGTNVALSKWSTSLVPFVELLEPILVDCKRIGWFDLIRFPDSCRNFVHDRQLQIDWTDVDRLRFDPERGDWVEH